MDRHFSSFVLKRTWQSSLLVFCSAAQLFDWVGAGFFTCLFLCMSCLDTAAALQQQHFGFSTVLPNHPQSLPKGDPHQFSPTCLCPALELSQGESAKTLWLPFPGAPCTSVRNPMWPLAQDLQRHCLPWDFCEPGIILSLLWRDHYSLSREVMSDWCSEVAN